MFVSHSPSSQPTLFQLAPRKLYGLCVHVNMCLAKLLPVQGQDFIKTQIRRRETGNSIRLIYTGFSRPPHQSCAYTFALILFGKTKTSPKPKGEQSLGLRCAMTSDKALSSESSAVRILPRDVVKMFADAMVVIILQHLSKSNQRIKLTHLKLTQCYM